MITGMGWGGMWMGTSVLPLESSKNYNLSVLRKTELSKGAAK